MQVILRAAILLGLAGASPSSPALAQAPVPARRASGPLADSLRAFAHHMAALLRSRDAEGTLGLYGDTSAFVHVDNGRIIAWPELSANVRRYFSTASSNPVSVVGEPGVTVADADNAVLYVTHRFDSTGARPAHGGVWTGMLHRFPQGWRIVHSHSSDRSPSH
jgi:hypothetical protein